MAEAFTAARPCSAVTAHLPPQSVSITSTKALGVSGYLQPGVSLLLPSAALAAASRMGPIPQAP